MQSRPVCLKCAEVVNDPVFEAPCGHAECPSAVFHGICLMEWREYREEFVRRMQERFRQLFGEHPLINFEDDD